MYLEKLIFCLVRVNIVIHNPTLLIREFGSGADCRPPAFADEGSVNHSGVYPPALCGFLCSI